jgi:DNA-binding response OmpR family regulator
MEAAQTDDVLYAGELEIRPGDGLVLAAGRALPLSVRELGLLVALVRRAAFIHTHVGFGYRFSPEASHVFHNSTTSR